MKVKYNVKETLSKIYVSYNMWTLTNDFLILIIIFHYIGINGKVRRIMVEMREVFSNKTRENLTIIIMEVIKD